MPQTACFDVFEKCVRAVKAGELIESLGHKDKEFHFQNWFERRLRSLALHFDGSGRNTYPDFVIVELAEGYEVKGLTWPGRERNYDSNSQVPCGRHNGREIFYVFGRYPKQSIEEPRYPVVDLVVCHGDFLNAGRDYVHKNKNVKGFGTYGDIMIRDRKMYVAPTPFALTEGTTGLMTLIVPQTMDPGARFQSVGRLDRTEADSLIAGYSFDLKSNVLSAELTPNPNAGTVHSFAAYRLQGDPSTPVGMVGYDAGTPEPADGEEE